MRRYPAYRDSGVPWLGEVPAHWEVKRIKHISRFVNGAAIKPGNWKESGIPIIRIENLNGLQEFNHADPGLDSRYVVHEGDLLFAWSGNRGTSFGPFLWNQPGEYYLNQHIFRLEGYQCDKQWLYWTLKGVTKHVEEQAHGIIGLVHITKEDLGIIVIPLPPPKEQDAIVAYLDRKLAEVDRFIAAKQRLIALLGEQKAAIINRAVTRGLDPDAPMKQSGIAWLGDVPAHWNIVRNRFVFHEVNERSISGAEVHLSMSQKHGLIPTDRIEEQTLQSENQEGFKICQVDDLVLNRLKAHLGVFAHATVPGLVSPDYTVLRLKAHAQVRYFEMLFRHPAYIAEFNKTVRGIVVGFLRLYTPDFYDIPSVIPPPHEQEEIIEFIDQKAYSIGTAISKAEREIELIKEYRATLIADAVTGKIDVYAAVAEEVEEVMA